MSRPLRIEYPGAFYHVLNRGVERRRIFRDDLDCMRFLYHLQRACSRFRVRVFAYCLMPNHYHLFLQTPKAKLGKFMQELSGAYVPEFNRRHDRVGPLFQSRYRAILVDGRDSALPLVRYIHVNPVAAGLVREPEGYPWSSYSAFLGKTTPPPWLDASWILAQVGGGRLRPEEALKQYTDDGIGEETARAEAEGLDKVFEGPPDFERKVKRDLVPRTRRKGVGRLRVMRKPEPGVLDAMERRVAKLTHNSRMRRHLVVYGLRRGTMLSMGEIAALCGLRSESAAAMRIQRLEMEARKDVAIRRLLAELVEQCREGWRR